MTPYAREIEDERVYSTWADDTAHGLHEDERPFGDILPFLFRTLEEIVPQREDLTWLIRSEQLHVGQVEGFSGRRRVTEQLAGVLCDGVALEGTNGGLAPRLFEFDPGSHATGSKSSGSADCAANGGGKHGFLLC